MKGVKIPVDHNDVTVPKLYIINRFHLECARFMFHFVIDIKAILLGF